MERGILGLLCFLALVTSSHSVYKEDPTSPNGYRLSQGASYLIVSPRMVRPAMTFRLRATIYRMVNRGIELIAHLSQDGYQYARATVIFEGPTTKQLELDVPDNIGPGRHFLTIEAKSTVSTGSEADVIFRNRTTLKFHSKFRSIFALTDKPLYLVTEGANSVTIKYRIIGLTPDMMPVIGPVTVYILDPNNIAVRRWRNEQLNIGMYENEFTLNYPALAGTWTIRVEAFGHKYDSTFMLDIRYVNKVEVNVTTPQRMFDSEWALVGTIYAEHAASNMNGEGNATIELTVRTRNGTDLEGVLRRHINHMREESSYVFPMADIKEKWGDVTDHDLIVNGWFYDWFLMFTRKGYSITRLLKDGIKVDYLGKKFRAFKPEQPLVVYFTVSRNDGTPYKGFFYRQLTISVTRTGINTLSDPEQKVIIPDNAIVKFETMARKHDTRIIIRASHHSSLDGTEEIRFFRHYNRNNHYIGITTSTEYPEVDRYMVFTVKTNFVAEEIQYVINARGNILLGNSLRMTGTIKTFSIAVSRQMTPFSKLIVYTVVQGVVVTDSIIFPVKDSRLAGASLSLNQGKDFHRRTIELRGRSHGGGQMIISGFQYQYLQRGLHSFLTLDDVFFDLLEYSEGSDKPHTHVWAHDNHIWDSVISFASQTNGMDAIQTFNTSGLYVFTDMNITDIPDFADATCNLTRGLGRCPGGECYEIKKRCDRIMDCLDGYDELDCPILDPVKLRDPFLIDLKFNARLFKPMHWLFKNQWIKPDGNMEMKINVPTDTQTLGIGGFALHPTEGLTIAPNIIIYDTVRKFYFKFECPKTIRRGEQVGVRLTLFNNQDESIEALVMLHGSPDYKMVKAGDHGYTSSYAPEFISGDVQVMVYMEPHTRRYLHFPVWPVEPSGEFEVKVSAFTFFDKDEGSCTMNVEYDGIACEEFTPYLIDLVNEGSVIIPDVEIVIPEQFFHPDEPYHRYVPGSESTAVNIFGDIVSPGFYHSHWSSEEATGLSHESADGFISDFAFNLQTMKYLESVNALDYDEAQTAMEFMRSILAQIYVFLHPDGGLKMFYQTDMDRPSIWVTLFGLRWLHAAASSQWNEELYIPINILNKLAMWLAKKQRHDGSYKEISTIYDPSFEPFTTDANGTVHEWHIPLTADTVTTLCGLSTHISGNAKVQSDAAAQKGADYLAQKLPFLVDAFQLATTAYALHTCGHPSKDRAFHMLNDIRRTDHLVYWANDVIPKNDEYIMNNVPIRLPRGDFINLNNAVTATSYAMMLYMRRESEVYDKMTIPMMRWLNEERNGPWGWASNRDTILALQALTEFAMHDHNRFVYFMRITSFGTNSPGWQMVTNLNSSNFDQVFEEEVPVAHGYVKTSAQGTGYAMYSVGQVYHVERQDQLDNPDYDTYDITIPKLHFSGKNFSIMEMEVCVNVHESFGVNKTHLTTISIELPTGYVPSWKDLSDIYKSNVTGLREVNFRNRYLIVFLEFVYKEEPVCVSFRADRWFPVANMTIQQVIRMNSYMETGIMWGQIYTTYSLHNLHICLVCGSYQCPYCPHYNHAPSCISHKTFTVVAAIFAIFFVTKLRNVFDCSLFGIK